MSNHEFRSRRSADTNTHDATQIGGPLERLRTEIEAVSAEPAPTDDELSRLDLWISEAQQANAFEHRQLSADALDMLAEVLPAASITAESQSRLQKERLASRASLLKARSLEAECAAESPAELFRHLRERVGMTAERTAGLFGIPVTAWVAIEQKKSPWYELRAEAVPDFAAAVHEPVEKLVALITLTARRAILQSIELRTNHALGRFDHSQASEHARLDTLRMAFALAQRENQGAAEFIEAARHFTEGNARPEAGPPSTIKQDRWL